MTSRTALLAAAARAAHLIVDDEPYVFTDPLAIALLGDRADELLEYHRAHGRHPVLAGARAQVLCRSRYTEDLLAASGIAQYVVLGAGLDTFAYRQPRTQQGAQTGTGTQARTAAGTGAQTGAAAQTGAGAVAVFEVDQPAMQEFKRESLRKAGIDGAAVYVPVDFERDDLVERLVRHGFDAARPAVVSWLGVTMYLTREAVERTVGVVAGFAGGTEFVFDHMVPEGMRDAAAQGYVDAVGPVNAQHGEPWLTFLSPADAAGLLLGTTVEHTGQHEPQRGTTVEHIGQREVLGDRGDALQPSNLTWITRATVRT